MLDSDWKRFQVMDMKKATTRDVATKLQKICCSERSELLLRGVARAKREPEAAQTTLVGQITIHD
jgi:hypothetical protein